MKLNTMAAVMSFVSRIETDSASFYENRAKMYPELEHTFLSWHKENKKFEKNIIECYLANFSNDCLIDCEYGLCKHLKDCLYINKKIKKMIKKEK